MFVKTTTTTLTWYLQVRLVIRDNHVTRSQGLMAYLRYLGPLLVLRLKSKLPASGADQGADLRGADPKVQIPEDWI